MSVLADKVLKFGFLNLYHLIKRESDFESIVMESAPEILSRLKLLGHIQRGEKIGCRNMILQPDGWLTKITRTWIYPDNRTNTLKLLREIISRSFEILIHNLSSVRESDIMQCKHIIADLTKSQVGLNNLKNTYSDDVKFGCDIIILEQQIIARLSEIKKEYPNLFEIDHAVEESDKSLN